MLTPGLDSGPILYHAFPPATPVDPFELGMLAVRAGHESLATRLADGSLWDFEPVQQDRTRELRYTRNADFDDDVASEYLGRLLDPDLIGQRLAARDMSQFVKPFASAN